MKLGAKFAIVLIVVSFAVFLFARTPDTDPVEMRAKYGDAPSQFITLSNGQQVHLRDEGPHGAPVLMLLHGSNSDLHTWQPWVDILKHDYRIIRFDQIGHGLTGPARNDSYTLEDFAADVDLVADALRLDRFVLGGNSMGGGIAVQYAVEHPERLDGLLLVDASGAPVMREDDSGNIGFTIAAMPVVNRLMKHITPRSLVEESFRQSVSNQRIVSPEIIDRYWELLRYPGNRGATIARFNTPRVPFEAARIKKLDVPTLILWGDEDSLVPVEAGKWYDRNLSDSQMIVFENIGHLPMEEAPEASAQAVEEWFARIKK